MILQKMQFASDLVAILNSIRVGAKAKMMGNGCSDLLKWPSRFPRNKEVRAWRTTSRQVSCTRNFRHKSVRSVLFILNHVIVLHATCYCLFFLSAAVK